MIFRVEHSARTFEFDHQFDQPTETSRVINGDSGSRNARLQATKKQTATSAKRRSKMQMPSASAKSKHDRLS